MNVRKVAWGSAALLAFLVLACYGALQALVDPARVRQAARDLVKTKWQRDLEVGDVSVRLFPVPSVYASRVVVADLADADTVVAALELLPLLTGNVKVKNLALRKLRVFTADGKESEPIAIDELEAVMGTDLRDVTVTALVSRYKQPLRIVAHFADLSKVGTPGAVTDGKVELAWEKSRATLSGKFPLEKTLAGGAIRAQLEAAQPADVFAFLGSERLPVAPLDLRFDARGAEGAVQVTAFAATLGALKGTGEATITIRGDHPVIDAHLDIDRLDWLKVLVDTGGTVRPRVRDEIVFHDNPIAWGAVRGVGKHHGKAALRIRSLRLGNGLELRNVRTTAHFGDARLDFAPFATEMLGGNAKGSIKFDAGKRTVRFDLDGDKLLLERWLAERGSTVPFKGGPLEVHARLSLAGDNYREFAASVAGTVALRMGRGTWNSPRAGEAEEMMVSALAAKDAAEIEFECASANLDFKSGRASGRRLFGARTTASQLLTAGHVDFREEDLDLRGRVRARKGVSLGLSNFASGVQIHGRIARPKMRLDPADKPAILAKAGAAIATAGATLLGGALVDAADSKNDPCEAVFK